MTGTDIVDKASKIFDYIASKTGEEQALNICKKLGFDNPNILSSRSYEDCVRLVDKFLMARSILGVLR